MKIFERREHEYYVEQRIFWLNFRFLNKKGFKLIENMPSILNGIKYQVLDPKLKELYPLPKIYDIQETIHLLQKNDFSIARYGDGEFRCMQEQAIPFQTPNKELAKRLSQILLNENPKLLVGIPNHFGATQSEFWTNYINQMRDYVYQHLNFDKTYVDACVTWLYDCHPKQAKSAAHFFQEFQKVWQDKDIIFVEGEESRLGYGNDLFSNARSIRRILCPRINAFNVYDKILTACQKQPKNCLFILALGPTATVLADDLSQCGYRALDLGHLDLGYEWLQMRADHIVPVPTKFTNKIKTGKHAQNIQDPVYLNQIIEKIEIR